MALKVIDAEWMVNNETKRVTHIKCKGDKDDHPRLQRAGVKSLPNIVPFFLDQTTCCPFCGTDVPDHVKLYVNTTIEF